MLFNAVKQGLSAVVRSLSRALRGLTGGSWKRGALRLGVLGCVLAATGFLVAWSGLVPISASSGHWPVTSWLLHFSMRQSVATHSMGISAPDLQDPALVLKGAAHYATGCAPCHGAPGQERALIVQQITPEPPFLPPKIPQWEPSELFWIVKHGVKFTAMPAWVSLEREDEVWALVAFLQRLPQLSPRQYRQLAYGDADDEETPSDQLASLADPPAAALQNCARCHGLTGRGRGPGAFPRLAGQSETYLLASLRAFAEGERHSGIMQPVAAALEASTRRELARYYASLPGSGDAAEEDAQAIARGRALAEQGDPGQGIPSCTDCHGPRPGPRNPYYPDLKGQYADYLALQLKLFKSGTRGGTPYAHIMRLIAGRLSETQIRDLALYYASLRQEPENAIQEVP